jgi:hypothetical protein
MLYTSDWLNFHSIQVDTTQHTDFSVDINKLKKQQSKMYSYMKHLHKFGIGLSKPNKSFQWQIGY